MTVSIKMPTTIRLHFQKPDGTIEDAQDDYELSYFGGVVPAAGDLMLDPGVLQGLSRTDPANRRMWEVVKRVFNPRDNEDYIALIVSERQPLPEELSLLPQG